MTRGFLLGLGAALICATSVFADVAAPPPVTQDQNAAMQAAAIAAIKDQLTDPDSAEFKWEAKGPVSVADLKKGWLGRKIPGVSQLLCGRVNAKNRMGGYVGYSWFWAAIQGGEVVESDLDSGDDNFAQQTCAKFGL